MNQTPRIETAEMSDADLDNIAGGLAVGASAGVFVDVASIATIGVGVGVDAAVEGVSADVAARVAL